MLKRWICCSAIWLFCTIVGSIPAGAHDLPVDRMMNSFVKIEPHQADFVVRVPLDLLLGVPFPLVGDHYNIAASRPAVETALKALATAFELWEGNVRLVPSSAAGQLAPLSDRSFEDYDQAVAQVAEPLAPDTVIAFQLGYLDAHFVYPISSPKSVFSIETRLAADLGDYTKLTIRYIPLGEDARAMIITGGSGRVALDPAWYQAAGRVRQTRYRAYFERHRPSAVSAVPGHPLSSRQTTDTRDHGIHCGALDNADRHRIQYRSGRRLVSSFIEMAIAVSIVYMAIENIVGANLNRRWIIAGLFGLVHGFGFADILKEQLQFAGSNLLVSLLSFNVGIEIGQLAVLCVFVPALALIFRGAMSGRMGIIVVSAIVAHTAWHWMIDRADVLWKTPWPQPTGAGLMILARWIVAVALAVVLAKLLAKWIERKWPGHILPAEDRVDA